MFFSTVILYVRIKMRARVIQLIIEFIKFFEKGQQLTYFYKISKTNIQHSYSQRK